MALLIALLATALLTIAVLQFTYETQVGYRRAVHWLEARRARLAAESGLALASEVLSFDGQLAELVSRGNVPQGVDAMLGNLDPRLAATDGFLDLWAHCSEPGPWSCVREIGKECSLPLSMAAVDPKSLTSPGAGAGGLGAQQAADAETDSEAGYFTVRIDDETGLYNLNRLVTQGDASDPERAARLLALVGVDAALAGRITDWVDRDTTPLAFPPGAEASQYTSEKLEPLPRNGPMASFQELALVMGFGAAQLREARKVMTVLPPDVKKINVNTAPLPVLQALSETPINDDLLMRLHTERCLRPFIDKDDLLARVPDLANTAIVPLLAYASAYFRVRSTARVADATQSVEALLHRNGARVETVYFLARRGANIESVDTSHGPGFDSPPQTRSLQGRS